MSLDVSNDISVSRFKQSLLSIMHERDLSEARCSSLVQRLQQQEEATKAAEATATTLRSQVDATARAQEEADQRAAAQQKTAEDERARHALATRLTSDKAATQQQKLQEQGQKLYQLEEQLRAQTELASRLAVEKEGADDLIGTFQSRLEEVGKVITSVSKSEAACLAVIARLREEQAEHERQLEEVQRAQRAAAPRELLERRLKAALLESQEAETRSKERAAALAAKEEELRGAGARHDQTAGRLAAVQQQLAEAHTATMDFEDERRQLGAALASAKALSLREQEKSDARERFAAAEL